MCDGDESGTELVVQANLTGEDQPECMLDVEALVAHDLKAIPHEILIDLEDRADGDLRSTGKYDEEPSDVFAQWAEEARRESNARPHATPSVAIEETLRLVSLDARKHYDAQMQICKTECSRHPLCILPNGEKLAISFAKRNLHQRAQEVRAILLANSARPGETNFMNGDSADSAARKRRRLQKDDNPPTTGRTSVVYSLFGRLMCRAAFSAVVQLKPETISRYARFVTESEAFEPLVSKANLRHLGKKGIQRTILQVFLSRYADDYGLESPTGVHSTGQMIARILPLGTTRQGVYHTYLLQWQSLSASALTNRPYATKTDAALSYSAFRRYWTEDMKHVRIATGGSDFCDLCTRLEDNLVRLPLVDPQRMNDLQLFKTHREESKVEFAIYKSLQRMWKFLPLENQSAYSRHYVFDFAEKVLLPRLLEQPGQLHFVTSLKFDINGVSSSRTNTNYIFGLPEGHWPNDKNANSVCSMLYHCFQLPTESEGRGGTLFLTADNCAGQNKNRFVLWFCCWLIMAARERRVVINFLICGHTKNGCAGSFGHVKRLLRRSNVKTPADMMGLIKESSKSTRCIPSAHVQWLNWKEMLKEYCTIPTTFGLSKYHEFVFDTENKGFVKARVLSNSRDVEKFFLLKRTKAEEALRKDWTADLVHEKWHVPIPNLSTVPSKQHGSRKGYLEHNILQQYYKDDEQINIAYFEAGTKGLEEQTDTYGA